MIIKEIVTEKSQMVSRLKELEQENDFNLKNWTKLYKKGIYEVVFFHIKELQTGKFLIKLIKRGFHSDYAKDDPMFLARVNRQKRIVQTAMELVQTLNES